MGTENQPVAETKRWVELAKAGQAHFEDYLSRLSDADLDGPSDLDGWTRKHVIAHFGYNAQALRRLANWAHTGEKTLMYESTDQRGEEIEKGSKLSAAELRELVPSAAKSLFEGWDMLTDEEWLHPILTAQGRTTPVNDTPWMRNREAWVHAIDLANGASFAEVPAEVVGRLVGEIYGQWTQRESVGDVTLRLTDAPDGVPATYGDVDAAGKVVVEGPIAGVARWATGRGAEPGAPITATRDGAQIDTPEPPRWL